MPRKVLLATDLSARCDRALDRAAALASEWQAELVAVHALEQDESFYTEGFEDQLPSWRRSADPARIAEAQLRRDMADRVEDVTVVVEKGNAADLVARVAEAEGCDIVVTGIARDETLGRFGLGNTVDRLLRRLKTPILIVRQRVRTAYGHIVVASDFSEGARLALQKAVEFFPDRRLTVFHAFETPLQGMTLDEEAYREHHREHAVERCRAFLAEARIPDSVRKKVAIVVEHGRPDHLVHLYARDADIDLVALGSHGGSPLLDVIFGSTAKAILMSLPCDALVVRHPGGRAED